MTTLMALWSDGGAYEARGARRRIRRRVKMIMRHATAAAWAALMLGATAAHAGPCTDRIYETDLEVAKLLDSAAAQGRPAPESTFATMHRQPTPGSVATAEQQAGDLTADELEAITEAMDVARHADDSNDRAGCEKALSDVDRMLDR
jgi:hypothetical protein